MPSPMSSSRKASRLSDTLLDTLVRTASPQRGAGSKKTKSVAKKTEEPHVTQTPTLAAAMAEGEELTQRFVSPARRRTAGSPDRKSSRTVETLRQQRKLRAAEQTAANPAEVTATEPETLAAVPSASPAEVVAAAKDTQPAVPQQPEPAANIWLCLVEGLLGCPIQSDEIKPGDAAKSSFGQARPTPLLDLFKDAPSRGGAAGDPQTLHKAVADLRGNEAAPDGARADELVVV